jgi:hypothetical protein
MKKVSFRIDEKLLSEKMDLGGFSSYSAFLREAVEKYNPHSDAIISSESLKHFKSQIEEIHTILKSLEPSNTLNRLTPPNTYKREPNSLPSGPPPKSHMVSELLVSVPETEQKISKFLNYRLNKKAET